MKIASKIKVLTLVLGIFTFCEVSPQSVWAAAELPPPPSAAKTDVSTSATSTGSTTIVNPSPSLVAPSAMPTTSASTNPTPATTVTTTVTTTAPAVLPSLPLHAENTKPVTPGSNLGMLENKVPDSVKEAVKHLDKSSTDEVTLDDLNSARQAVAKIEALIDIEKHLAELDRVRLERNKSGFVGAIPASALQPPLSMGSAGMGGGQPMGMPTEKLAEVSRIMGRNGSYSAVMKMSDDKTRTVKVGDHLPDGGKVISITSTEVNIMHGSVSQVLRVKNVETVFGSAS